MKKRYGLFCVFLTEFIPAPKNLKRSTQSQQDHCWNDTTFQHVWTDPVQFSQPVARPYMVLQQRTDSIYGSHWWSNPQGASYFLEESRDWADSGITIPIMGRISTTCMNLPYRTATNRSKPLRSPLRSFFFQYDRHVWKHPLRRGFFRTKSGGNADSKFNSQKEVYQFLFADLEKATTFTPQILCFSILNLTNVQREYGFVGKFNIHCTCDCFAG
jgi:hypothetical protein